MGAGGTWWGGKRHTSAPVRPPLKGVTTTTPTRRGPTLPVRPASAPDEQLQCPAPHPMARFSNISPLAEQLDETRTVGALLTTPVVEMVTEEKVKLSVWVSV